MISPYGMFYSEKANQDSQDFAGHFSRNVSITILLSGARISIGFIIGEVKAVFIDASNIFNYLGLGFSKNTNR